MPHKYLWQSPQDWTLFSLYPLKQSKPIILITNWNYLKFILLAIVLWIRDISAPLVQLRYVMHDKTMKLFFCLEMCSLILARKLSGSYQTILHPCPSAKRSLVTCQQQNNLMAHLDTMQWLQKLEIRLCYLPLRLDNRVWL